MHRSAPPATPIVRLVFDLVPAEDNDDVFFIARMQKGFAPMSEVFSDYSHWPVSVHMEGEWLDVMSGMLGSALIAAGNRRLALYGFESDGSYPVAAETTA